MGTMQPSRFGGLLRRYRLAAGLTQEELAARANRRKNNASMLRTRMSFDTARITPVICGCQYRHSACASQISVQYNTQILVFYEALFFTERTTKPCSSYRELCGEGERLV